MIKYIGILFVYMIFVFFYSSVSAIDIERVKAKHFSKRGDGVKGQTQYFYQSNEKINRDISSSGAVNYYSVELPEDMSYRDLEINTVKKNTRLDIYGNQKTNRSGEEIANDIGTNRVSEKRSVKRVYNYTENVTTKLKRSE